MTIPHRSRRSDRPTRTEQCPDRRTGSEERALESCRAHKGSKTASYATLPSCSTYATIFQSRVGFLIGLGFGIGVRVKEFLKRKLTENSNIDHRSERSKMALRFSFLTNRFKKNICCSQTKPRTDYVRRQTRLIRRRIDSDRNMPDSAIASER